MRAIGARGLKSAPDADAERAQRVPGKRLDHADPQDR